LRWALPRSVHLAVIHLGNTVDLICVLNGYVERE